MKRLLLILAFLAPCTAQAQFTAPAMLSSLAVQGSGPPPPACSGTNYFVSNSGNNANNGTSTGTPWQTIAKVNTGPGGGYGANSCINFNGGQNFSGNLALSSTSGGCADCATQPTLNVVGVSPSAPITVRSYGTGNATITSSTGGDISATVIINNVNGFVVQNLIVRSGISGACPGGIGANCTNVGVYVTGASTGTVSGNDIGGFFVNDGLVIGGGDITSSVRTDSSGDVTISGNILHGLTTAALDDDGVQVNGSSGNITIIGNELFNFGGRPSNANFGGEGMNLLNQNGGLISVLHNKVHDIAFNFTNQCGAGSGIETAAANNGIIAWNEVYRVQINSTAPVAGCDGDGIDLDGNTSNWIVEYNFTHDNTGSGLYAYMGCNAGCGWTNNTYRYNISLNDSYTLGGSNQFGAMAFDNTGATNPVVFAYNNTIVATRQVSGCSVPANCVTALEFVGPLGAGSVIANNILVVGSGSSSVVCNSFTPNTITWRNNGYFGGGIATNCGSAGSLGAWEATSGETGGTIANPSMGAPPAPPGDNCVWTPPTGPQPCPNWANAAASAYAGTGLNVSSIVGGSMGTQAYSGLAIPSGIGSGYDIGAYGSTCTGQLFLDKFASGYTTNWNINFPWDAGVNVYTPTYVQADPNVSPGMNAFSTGSFGLKIAAAATNGNPDAQGRLWYTGLLASKATYTFGYFEFKTAMPLSPGGSVNGANWIYQTAPSQNAEVDTIEHQANVVMQTLWANSGPNPTHNTTVGDVTQFHTYGSDLQPDFVTFYIDGVQKFQTPTLPGYLLGTPMQITLSINIGNCGQNPNSCTPNTDGTTIPQFMTVQYAGVWTNKAARDTCSP